MPSDAPKMSHTRLAWNLFHSESVHHGQAAPSRAETDGKETDMSHSNAIAKIVSVTTLGLFTAALLLMALAPAPSLFAG